MSCFALNQSPYGCRLRPRSFASPSAGALLSDELAEFFWLTPSSGLTWVKLFRQLGL
jgi:hypothetical protein